MNKEQIKEWFDEVDKMHPTMRPCMQGFWCGNKGAMGMGGETMWDAWINWRVAAKTGNWHNGIEDWKYC